MKLFIVSRNGDWGLGGGFSFLVCADTFGEAVSIVADLPEKELLYKYASYEVAENADLGEMEHGDWRRICYYE